MPGLFRKLHILKISLNYKVWLKLLRIFLLLSRRLLRIFLLLSRKLLRIFLLLSSKLLRIFLLLSSKLLRILCYSVGEVDDESDVPQDRDWSDYWRLLFKKVSVDDIKTFENDYKGTVCVK